MNILEIKRDLKENRYIRYLLAPYMKVKKQKAKEAYLQSDYSAQMRTLKDSHKGEKCYVIGSGPSLKVKDLEMIEKSGACSIASNKIYLIYDKTLWRPNFYIAEDSISVIDDIAGDIDKIQAEKIILNWKAAPKIGIHKNIIYGLFCPEFIVNLFDYRDVYVSKDCSMGFGWAGTVTFAAIQLAIYMGFSEIYLLGVDFSYQNYKDAKGRKQRVDGVKQNYFKGGGYKWTSYMCKITSERGYRTAKQYCDTHGIVIKNATRGGQLEIFDRITLEDTL